MDEKKSLSRKKRVLFLEDEKVLGQIYKKKLQEAGFNVKWLKTADETTKMAKKFKADLIILDHAIRGESKTGLDILPDLKRILPDSKIVMLSNYSQFQLEKKTLEAGAVSYLVKINTPPATLVHHANKLLR